MIAKEITVEQFEGFVTGHPQHSFFQTEALAKRRTHDGWGYVYLGFFDAEVIVGAAMLFKRKILFNKYQYECMGGPITDYNRAKEVFEALKVYVDEHGVYECLINPNVVAYYHNIEKNDKEEANNYESASKAIHNTGFKIVENVNENEDLFNWFYKKDLTPFDSEEALLDSFERETKRLIGLSLQNNLMFEELEPSEFSRLKTQLDMTADNKDFASRTMDYFTTLSKYFNEKHDVKMVVVSLDVKAYRKPLEDQIADLLDKIKKDTETNTKRSMNRVNQNTDVLNATKKKLAVLENIKEDKVDVCGGVFLFMDHEVTYLLGGSDHRYFSFNGPQFMQWHVMKEALKRNVSTYNFYGTHGSFMGRPEEDGVYFFKKGFNGYLVENFGYYLYEAGGFMNGVIRTLKKLR